MTALDAGLRHDSVMLPIYSLFRLPDMAIGAV